LTTKQIKISKEIFDFKYTKAVLKMVKKLTIARIILQILIAVLPLVPLYLMKLLLDAFVTDTKPSFEYVIWILVGFALVRILTIMVNNTMNYVSMLQSEVVSDYMANIVLNKAIDTDVEYFDSDAYHDVFSRAVAQSGSRPTITLMAVTSFLQNSISLLAIGALLITLHWAVSLILIFIAMPVALIRWYYTNKTVALNVNQTQKEERRKLYRNQNAAVGVVQGVEAVAIISALGFIAMQAIRGLISVGDIAMYYGAFQKGQTSINAVLKSLVSINENRMYLNHLFEFLELEKKITDPENQL